MYIFHNNVTKKTKLLSFRWRNDVQKQSLPKLKGGTQQRTRPMGKMLPKNVTLLTFVPVSKEEGVRNDQFKVSRRNANTGQTEAVVYNSIVL